MFVSFFCVVGLGQTTLGGGGLTLNSLLATSTTASAPAPSIGLGGVDFSTSSENKSDASSGANAQYVYIYNSVRNCKVWLTVRQTVHFVFLTQGQ